MTEGYEAYGGPGINVVVKVLFKGLHIADVPVGNVQEGDTVEISIDGKWISVTQPDQTVPVEAPDLP